MKTIQNSYFTEHLSNSLSFEMIWVQGGSFQMGNRESDAEDYELPVHEVQVSDFFIGKYPVTQALYQAIMGETPSNFNGKDHPVEQVSWEEAQAFIQKLNNQVGKSYRLLTEAEWEYAARGGIYSEDYLYAGSDNLKEVGWYVGNNNPNGTKPVGQKLPNELGIYDMSGNVYEWCEDDYHDNYQGALKDGSAWLDQPSRGGLRVLRGGSWLGDARYCRVSYRNGGGPDFRDNYVGFRLALSPV
ncbi:MAG: formylglycine-generating enzyme family protein [Bacteroidota bacterium]